MKKLVWRDGALPCTEYIQYVCTRSQVQSPHGTKTTGTNIENLLFGALVHYLLVLLVRGKPTQKFTVFSVLRS